MKSTLFSNGKVSVFLLTALIFLFAAPSILPQSYESSHIDKRFTDNLNAGIKSNNEGLRKSCIYFTGLYLLKECVPTLLDQLSKEKIADVKILIALSLYRIGDKKGIKAIESLSMNDENARVRKMGKAILVQFEKGSHAEYNLSNQ